MRFTLQMGDKGSFQVGDLFFFFRKIFFFEKWLSAVRRPQPVIRRPHPPPAVRIRPSASTLAVFTVEDEQIVWTDKSSQTDKSSDEKTGPTNFQTTLSSQFVRLFARL